MNAPLMPLLASGFLLGWSVAWPPGPINAEIARRCLAGGFWAGFTLLLGACSADALWAVLVSLGVGVLFAGPVMREVLGVISVALLLSLCGFFLLSAWRALRSAVAASGAPSRFDSRRASFFLGAGMALTSPWNVAFWLAAMGRPELSAYGVRALLIMAAAVIAGALTWGVLWSGSIIILHRRADSGAGGRWCSSRQRPQVESPLPRRTCLRRSEGSDGPIHPNHRAGPSDDEDRHSEPRLQHEKAAVPAPHGARLMAPRANEGSSAAALGKNISQSLRIALTASQFAPEEMLRTSEPTLIEPSSFIAEL
jgi:threonine/homoserine/homoserine lactone efflux protein